MWNASCILAASIALSGCVLSVEPVVPESEATFDARLLGSWESVEGSEHAVASRAGDAGYAIAYTDGEGKTGHFQARLGLLGDNLILDVWPALPEDDMAGPDEGLLVKGHMPLALKLEADTVQVAELDSDVLLAAIRAGDVPLSYARSDDRLILLDTTDALRRALTAYLERDGVLGETLTWRRMEGRPAGSSTAEPAGLSPCFEASAWPEADHLFRRDRHWVGADGAYSIDLGQGRTLWLFGDTWIDPSGRHTRQGARMIRNSVAIQTGSDPSGADIAFYWHETTQGEPAPFFADEGDAWFWPGHGIRLGDRLLLFLMRIRSSQAGLGFESAGWNAVMVSNPDEAPSSWRVSRLETPRNALGVVVGSASIFRSGQHVYAFGSQESVKSHPMYVVRWRVESVLRGDLRAPEWWAGVDVGWVPDTSLAARWPAFEAGQSELTVHYDSVAHQFVGVQHVGFGPADLTLRAAPDVIGPWSEPRMIYRPAEYYRPNIMIYAAKAHPQLTGADLIVSYATNTFHFAEQLTDSLIYYPRFVRLARCR